MKLKIAKHELNEAIQQVAKAVSSRPTIPILGGIKFEVNHMGVTLTASDTDISIQSFLPVERDQIIIAHVDKPGSVVLPAKFFVEIVKKLPSDQIVIEVSHQFPDDNPLRLHRNSDGRTRSGRIPCTSFHCGE